MQDIPGARVSGGWTRRVTEKPAVWCDQEHNKIFDSFRIGGSFTNCRAPGTGLGRFPDTGKDHTRPPVDGGSP